MYNYKKLNNLIGIPEDEMQKIFSIVEDFLESDENENEKYEDLEFEFKYFNEIASMLKDIEIDILNKNYEIALNKINKIKKEINNIEKSVQELQEDNSCKKIIFNYIDEIQKHNNFTLHMITEILEAIYRECEDEEVRGKIRHFEIGNIPVENGKNFIINFLRSLNNLIK